VHSIARVLRRATESTMLARSRVGHLSHPNSLRPIVGARRRTFSSSSASSAAAPSSSHSHANTLSLPKTPFPLRADAAKREHLFRSRTTDELYAWQVSPVSSASSTSSSPDVGHRLSRRIDHCLCCTMVLRTPMGTFTSVRLPPHDPARVGRR
jgi:hypothetical protein